MRRGLVLVALACVSAILLAVLIPLAVVVHTIAQDRAIADARQHATAIIAMLAGAVDRDVIRQGITDLTHSTGHELGVHLAGHPPLGRTRLDLKTWSYVAEAVPVADGLVVVQPVRLASGAGAVVEVHVSCDAVTQDVLQVWAILAATTVAMFAGAVVLVDRLAIRLVRNISRLAVAARAFGGGDLTRRVDPSGPRELVDAAMSFNIMAEQIVGLLAAERELAADLSHRLRTPLTALRLDAQRLGADQYAERVKHAATLLEYELDEMITASRRPLHDRKPAPADLTELVSERAQFWASLAEDERRRWGICIPSHVVSVAVPREDLVAAVDVLLGNIFRHTGPGTPYVIRLDVAGPAAVLVVEDAGRGFDNSPDALRRGSSTGSTGLGLDIARRVAESTGGSIRLERSRLGGALVELRFALAFPVTT